jgi:peptidoglycan/LPS O-acetylase OafA/YrhL
LVALEAIGGQLRYALWPLVIAVLFASIMLRWAWLPTDAPAPSRGLADPILSAIGLGAYSIYLTHPLCIHAANIIAQKAPWPSVSYWPIAISLIAIAALGFYFLVERPCIVWRDRWIPSSNKPSVRIAHHDIAKGPAL